MDNNRTTKPSGNLSQDLEDGRPVLIRRSNLGSVREVEEGESRRVRFIASTDGIKRDGNKVRNDGWQLDNFLKNPRFLWSHDSGPESIPAIGSVRNIDFEKIEDGGSAMIIDVEFASHPFADMIYTLYKEDHLSAVSIGWTPLRAEPLLNEDGNQIGWDFIESELLEVSAVNIPADPDALMVAAQRGLIPYEKIGDFDARAIESNSRGIAYVLDHGSSRDLAKVNSELRARYKGVEIDTKPTKAMAEEAERGLEWRSETGKGGTEVGVARARDLKNRVNLSLDTVKRMASYFARHEADKGAEGFNVGEDGYPSAGRIAWALWGGDPGQRWAGEIVERMKRIDEEEREAPEMVETVETVETVEEVKAVETAEAPEAHGRDEHEEEPEDDLPEEDSDMGFVEDLGRLLQSLMGYYSQLSEMMEESEVTEEDEETEAVDHSEHIREICKEIVMVADAVSAMCMGYGEEEEEDQTAEAPEEESRSQDLEEAPEEETLERVGKKISKGRAERIKEVYKLLGDCRELTKGILDEGDGRAEEAPEAEEAVEIVKREAPEAIEVEEAPEATEEAPEATEEIEGTENVDGEEDDILERVAEELEAGYLLALFKK